MSWWDCFIVGMWLWVVAGILLSAAKRPEKSDEVGIGIYLAVVILRVITAGVLMGLLLQWMPAERIARIIAQVMPK